MGLYCLSVLISCEGGSRPKTDDETSSGTKNDERHSISQDACSGDSLTTEKVARLKGQSWHPVPLERPASYQKNVVRTHYVASNHDSIHLYAHYLGERWLTSDSLYIEDTMRGTGHWLGMSF